MIKKILKKLGFTRTGLVRFLKPLRWYLLRVPVKPLSPIYGIERGAPIDRYYIERFLAENAADIRGTCLEIKDNTYTVRFGGSMVSRSDILDIEKSNTRATIYGDLRNLTGVTTATYDCVILTQVLQFIDDYESAVRECHRILKPGGVLLASVPSLSRVDCVAGVQGDFWRFTAASAKYVFKKYFARSIHVASHGNVAVGVGFWTGAAQEDLSKNKLNVRDENFPCVITVRAVKDEKTH